MKNILLGKVIVFGLTMLSVHLYAQDFKAIDLGHCQPNVLNDSGFAQLKQKIGDKRFVIIGEQQHGVGTGYINFANMVKFLHEEMGFNVILQEYCFYGFGEINKRLQQGGSAQEYRKAMYWPQGHGVEMNQILDYLDEQRQMKSPIYMEGFDSRLAYNRLCWLHLDSLISNSGIEFSKSLNCATYLKTLKRALANEYRDTIADKDAEIFLQNTDVIIEQLRIKGCQSRELQLLRSIKGFVKNSWNYNHVDEEEALIRYHNREKQMYENAVWLIEEAYPKEKFILLMHNAHAAKNLNELIGHIPDRLSKNPITIGDLLYKKYGNQTIHIATTHYNSSYCYANYKPIAVPPPHKESLEAKLNNKHHEYAYVDLTPYQDSSFYMYHFNFNDYADSSLIKARFGRIYDGVIFIKQGKAATQPLRAFERRDWLLEQKLPDWAYNLFRQQKLDSTLALNDQVNPYYLEGDFNGDKKIDIAFSVRQISTNKMGFVVMHSGTKYYQFIGAGKEFGKGGDNYRWLDYWKVYKKGKVKVGFKETHELKLNGDAILVGYYMGNNALIYWNGKEHKWYQQDGF